MSRSDHEAKSPPWGKRAARVVLAAVWAAAVVVAPSVSRGADSVVTLAEATGIRADMIAAKLSLQTAWAYAGERDATYWSSLRAGESKVTSAYKQLVDASWPAELYTARESVGQALVTSLTKLQTIDRPNRNLRTRDIRAVLDDEITRLNNKAQDVQAFTPTPAPAPAPAPVAEPEPEPEPAAPAPSDGIPVLVAGAGFTAATPQPPAVGSGRGADAKAIARWDVVPYQTVTGTFTVGVVAFHMAGIDRVEFSVNGGPWAASRTMTLNPTTGVWEYCAKVDAAAIPDGNVEVRAVVHPTVGLPRVLAGAHDSSDRALVSGEYSLFLSANQNGTLSSVTLSVSPTGNDTTGDGSATRPFATIQRAVSQLTTTQGAAEGATILLSPGDYAYPSMSPAPATTRRWLTIAAAPGVTNDRVRITSAPGSTGLATKLVRLKGVSVVATELDDGAAYSRIWADGCVLEGASPLDATRFFPLTQWTGGIWVTDSTIRNVKYPAYGHMLTRGTLITDVGGDAFREPSGLVANCEVRNLVTLDDTHNDVVQFWDPQPRSGFENVIFYGMKAVQNINAQALFVQQYGAVSYDNFAFVNYLTYATIGGQWQNPGNHLVLWNSEFLSPPEALATNKGGFMFVDVGGRPTNVHNADVRNSVFQRFNLLHTGSEPSLTDQSWAQNNHYIDVVSYMSASPGSGATTGGSNTTLLTDSAAGDFTPLAGSALVNRVQTLLVPADVSSRARRTPDAVGAVGAVQ